MNPLVSALLFLAGVIHLLPLAGLGGAPRIERMYGIDISDPNVAILLVHRALMFGLVGTLLIAAAFRQELRGAAILGGLVSAAGFVVVAMAIGGFNRSLRRVVGVDAVAIVALLAAAFLNR